MLYEVANAIRFHPGATAVEVKDAVKELAAMQIAAQDLTDPLTSSAAELAYSENITFYDAIYLALAQALGTKTLTADEKLHKRVKRRKALSMLLRNYK
jgi:predicted nucleic acid-binding protein